MNKNYRYLLLLALLPLIASVFPTDYFLPVNAASTPDICGLQFCSEIPGGRDAWLAGLADMILFGDDAPEVDDAMTSDEVVEEEAMPSETEVVVEEEAMPSETEVVVETSLKLSRANVPVDIPMSVGFYNGEQVYFITTDSSDADHADLITEEDGWKVEYAPLLANVPDSALSVSYFITNGPKSDMYPTGEYTIFSNTPAQADVYTALTDDIHVTWVDESNATMLASIEDVLAAEQEGLVALDDIGITLNSPQIVWPEGQMLIKESIGDGSYGGGQVLGIDTEEMTVTFIAHRGWGPDGRTVYYIVTDATPSGPAMGMGVAYSPMSAQLLVNPAAVDLFQFKNGIAGTGPLGFQPGIASGALGDINYSPMWRIFFIEWNDPAQAELLETVADINAYVEAGLINISIARPMDSDHIVNCPFIDPFQ